MKQLVYLLTMVFALLLTGCASQKIADYEQVQPTLNLRTFFSGTVVGYGMFQGRDGTVKKRFEVTIVSKEENGKLILDETFVWSDTTTSKRIWTLTEQSKGVWHGTAADVVGKATGTVAGNALHWNYVLALPVDDSVYNVSIDDWMYLINKDVILNRSVMSKFGVNVGSITLSLHRK